MTEVQMVSLMIVASGLLLFVARQTNLPQSLLLIVCGILVGFIPGLPELKLNSAIVLDLLLPPLLYAGTVTASVGLLRRNIWAGALLGVLLIFATTGAVASAARAVVPELPWVAAVLLGLIASVGGANEFREANEGLHVPRRIADKLKAEELISSVIIVSGFLIALKAGETGRFSPAGAALKFAADIFGGGSLGACVGYLAARLRYRIHAAPVEIAVSLSTPYAAVLVASGVGVSPIPVILLAGFVVAANYINPQTGRTQSSPDTRLAADAFWSVSKFIVGGVLLFLIGLALPTALAGLTVASLPTLVAYAFGILLIALLVRFAFALLASLLARGRSEGEETSAMRADVTPLAEATLLMWASTRSVIGVVVALAIPLTTNAGEPFPGRNLLIALTCLVTLASISIQGLTLRRLIIFLGLSDREGARREEQAARDSATRAALQRLDDIARSPDAMSDGNGELSRRLRHYYEQRLAQEASGQFSGSNDGRNGDGQTKGAKHGESLKESRSVREATLDAERRALLLAHNRSALGDEAYRRLVHEVDVEAERLKSNNAAAPPP